MNDILRMKVFQRLQHLLEIEPNDIFLERRFQFDDVLDVLVEVSTFCVVCHDAELFGPFIKECIAVAFFLQSNTDDVRIL